MKLPTLWRPALASALVLVASAHALATAPRTVTLRELSTIRTGVYENGGAEIVAYDRDTQRLFFVNAAVKAVEVYSITDPAAPVQLASLPLPSVATAGGGPTSVDVDHGLVAVAAEGALPTDPGTVSFFDASTGNLLSTVAVGAFPDNLVFTPNGRNVLVANEGSPNTSYTVDPEGSVSIIRIRSRDTGPVQSDVSTATFTAFNNAPLPAGVRVYGPGATVAQDLEPEYIAVSPDNREAYVTLQENNAVAVVDIKTATVTALRPLGLKDHRLPGNTLDGSDRDGPGNTPLFNPRNWPVFGLYQPDNIAAFNANGRTYYITANEGDAREYAALTEEARVSTLALDTAVFPDAATLKTNAAIGRLNVSRIGADSDGNGLVDKLYALGGRSFSIWNAETGAQVFDSGDEIERTVAAFNPLLHNASNETNNSFDNRSDNKGAEPEALAVGQVRGRTYAFVSLERPGGILVYDITTPESPDFVEYVNNRVLSGNPAAGSAGDLGPEGVTFVPAAGSPDNRPLLLVANEISGTVTIYEIASVPAP